MKVFVAYCHDRHVDPHVKVFFDWGRAVEYIRDFMIEHCAHPEHIHKVEQSIEGCVLWLGYADEDDHAFVMESEVDSHPGARDICQPIDIQRLLNWRADSN